MKDNSGPEVFLTQNDVGRRVNVNHMTLTKRLKAHGFMPDGLVLNGGRPEIQIFRSSRLPQIRALFTGPKTIA